MFKNYYFKITIVFLLIFWQNSTMLMAGELKGEEARALVSGAKRIFTDDRTGSLKMIELYASEMITKEEIPSFIDELKRTIFAELDIRYWDQFEGKDGMISYRYKFYVNDIEVEYGILKFHANRDGKIGIINGESYGNGGAVPDPAYKYGHEDMNEIVGLDFGNTPGFDISNFEIQDIDTVYFPSNQRLYLAYKFPVYSVKDGKLPFKRMVYVDVMKGKILHSEQMIHDGNVTGQAVTLYNDTVSVTTDSVNANMYVLKNSGTLNTHTHDLNSSTSYGWAIDFVDSNNFWNTTTNLDLAANDAHYGSEKTLDYYFNVHGRLSYDNLGSTVNSYIHYGNSFNNAFWDGTQMTYGDGDGISFTPFTSIDVVSHEITHGVTSHTANLVYSYESGALNESFSDIFGVTVDYYANPSTANFLIGDQISLSGSSFRNMQNPNLTQQPDTYQGVYWEFGSADNGGVHTNSQVQNYWFYLLCNGGSGTNDNSDSYNITAIGMSKAEKIAFRTLNNYLTTNSQYADARTYSIQSAIDLYGVCSPEVMAVTNAWHAVGVGNPFNNSVQADFSVNDTFFCSIPATVNFTNTSVNDSTWLWYFGDGDSSTLSNPTHVYTSPGIYTVTLIVNGSATCGGNSDTLILSNYIVVSNQIGPTAAACTPSAPWPSMNSGILNFTLDSINNTSQSALEGYMNFSCTGNTTLYYGSQYPLSVTSVGYYIYEKGKVWVDLDSNGVFGVGEEMVAFDFSNGATQSSILSLPSNVALNTPLRLRVLVDNSSSITSACQTPVTGQYEDYSITVMQSTQAPVADFQMSHNVVTLGGTVNFVDISTNGPTSWTWTINGATPSSASSQNTSATFNTIGTYQITLYVSNAYGSDSITKTIEVVNVVYMCDSIATQTINGSGGIIYDSGGPLGLYGNYESCSVLIDPVCSDSIILEFPQFKTESYYDVLRVYDGSSSTGTLLFSGSGYLTPNPVVATSGQMYIQWSSDGSVVDSGYTLNWTNYAPPSSSNINAAFVYSPSTPALMDSVQFTDQSTGLAAFAWNWDFGDGSTSTDQNPIHQYQWPGTYPVQLIVNACGSSDTITQFITTQASPQISYSPTSFAVSMGCNDTIDLNLAISNLAGGVLNWDLSTGSNIANNEVLAWLGGVDTLEEWPNLLTAINQNFTGYNLTTTHTSSASVLQSLLVGKSVLIIPEIEDYYVSSIFSSLVPVIQNFVNSGGTLIMFPPTYSWGFLDSLGIFTGVTYAMNFISIGTALSISNNTTPLTNGLTGSSILSENATISTQITNLNKQMVVAYPSSSTSNNDVVTAVPYGLGRAIYVGYDFYSFNANIAKIVANAVEWGIINSAANSNVTILPSSGSTLAGATDSVVITLNSDGLSSGLDTLYVYVQSNDTANSIDSIPIYLNISNLPCADFAIDTFPGCSGIINFMDNSTHNPTSWFWDFGDGATSMTQNPSHTYTSSGVYSVMLVVSNTSGSDTLYQNLTISNTGGPVYTSCIDQTVYTCCGYGITNFSVNTINRASPDASEGYQDLTCQYQTVLTKGNTYPISITSGSGYSERFMILIDFDNDGSFNTSEIILDTTLYWANNTCVIQYTVPNNVLTNTPLRMRVLSFDQFSSYAICNGIGYGQAEDYAITFVDPSPVADFTGTPLIAYINEAIQLTDISTQNPTSWMWTMSGATPSSSTQQNPSITYTSPGYYSVKLLAANNGGADSITKSNYIQVIDLPSMSASYEGGSCQYDFTFFTELIAPYTTLLYDFGDGSAITTTADTLSHTYSSAGNYSVNIIAQSPYGNDTMTMQINIYSWSGSISNVGSHVVNAAIDFSASTNGAPTSYDWDFGDGYNSTLSNPTHVYTADGLYYVRLELRDSVKDCILILYDTLDIRTTAINNPDLSGISIFPVPFDDLISVKSSNFSLDRCKVKIYTILGQELSVSFMPLNSFEINIKTEGLAAGHYFLHLEAEDKIFVFKINKE